MDLDDIIAMLTQKRTGGTDDPELVYEEYQRELNDKLNRPKKPAYEPWICPDCGELNGRTSAKCITCRKPRPANTEMPSVPKPPAPWKCPYCRHVNISNAVLCDYCGRRKPEPKPIPAAPWKCSHCGAENGQASRFCVGCGDKKL